MFKTEKPSIEIIAVTYNETFALKCFIDSIRSQTSQNWKLHIIHDGNGKKFEDLKEDLISKKYVDQENIVLSATEKRYNNWGHSLREYGLNNRISNAEYIMITNCDNYYCPVLVEEIESAIKKEPDFIYWDCVHNHKNANFDRPDGYGLLVSQLEYSKIDIGCAAVKSTIAEKIGFPYTNMDADWDYFRDCLREANFDKLHKINKILFVHN